VPELKNYVNLFLNLSVECFGEQTFYYFQYIYLIELLLVVFFDV